jgi:hypothetical protein
VSGSVVWSPAATKWILGIRRILKEARDTLPSRQYELVRTELLKHLEQETADDAVDEVTAA